MKVIPIFYPVFSPRPFLNDSFKNAVPYSKNDPRIRSPITKLAMENLLNLDEINILLEQHKNSHLGVVPHDFLSCGTTPQKVFETFDTLVPKTTTVYKNERTNYSKSFELNMNGNIIQGTRVGSGEDGVVYKLLINGTQYALKIFKDIEDHDWRNSRGASVGPKTEISNGLYFTAQPTKDLSSFYFGNPIAGYAVYEWIDEKTNFTDRPGLTLHEQGFKPDCNIFDPKNKRINGIVADHGRITTLERADSFFITSFQSPDLPGKQFKFDEIGSLPEAWRLHAFKYLLGYCPEAAYLSQDGLKDIPANDRLEGLAELLKAIPPDKIIAELTFQQLWEEHFEAAQNLIEGALSRSK